MLGKRSTRSTAPKSRHGPTQASENNFTIRPLQPRVWNRYAVFFTHAREALTFNYERKLYEVEGVKSADPPGCGPISLCRLTNIGNVLKSVSIGYGRRFGDNSGLPHGPDQAEAETNPAHVGGERLHECSPRARCLPHSLVFGIASLQLYNFQPEAHRFGVTNLFRFEEMQTKVLAASDGLHDLPYEDMNASGRFGGDLCRRLFQRSRTFYRSDNLENLLPLGVLQSLALPGRAYQLAFTRV